LIVAAFQALPEVIDTGVFIAQVTPDAFRPVRHRKVFPKIDEPPDVGVIRLIRSGDAWAD
jgi:hypothetical protein